MTDDKFLLLQMHPCTEGLPEAVVREVAEASELIRCQPDAVLHRSNQSLDSVYLVIHGRLRQTLFDIQGNVALLRYQVSGGQVGAVAAALGEPSPVEIAAEDPSTLLRIDYRKALDLTRRHPQLRENFSKMIAESTRSLLMKHRNQKIPLHVTVFHQSMQTRQVTQRLIERLRDLGETISVMSDRSDWPEIADVTHFCLLKGEQFASELEVRQQRTARPDATRIFIDVSTSIPLAKSVNLFETSQKVFWCVTPDNWAESIAYLQTIQEKAAGWRDKVNVIWLLDRNTRWATHAGEFSPFAKRQFKLSFEPPLENCSSELQNGLERIVHQLRGVRIGLALGGGAARGMAHLGVLKILAQNGIVIDMIAGTSAGAMTGILYASGMAPDYSAAQFVRDLKLPWLFRKLPNGGAWYLLYKYRTGQFDPMLRKYLKDSRLEQLAIPVCSVTVDLVSGKPVSRWAGDAVNAITESINLPGLSVPINRDGQALVDGGIVNNVPADVLVEAGCNFIIAVSVTAKLTAQFATNAPDTPTSKMKSASTLQTLIRTFLVQSVNMNSVGVQPADFVIQPEVTEFESVEFSRAQEMADIGAASTEMVLPQLKKILSHVDAQLFSEP